MRNSYYLLLYLFLLISFSFQIQAQIPPLVQIQTMEQGASHFGLELAHFSQFEEMNKYLLRFEQKGIQNVMLHYTFKKEDEMEFILIAGPYTKQQAKRQKGKWKRMKISSKIVDLKEISTKPH